MSQPRPVVGCEALFLVHFYPYFEMFPESVCQDPHDMHHNLNGTGGGGKGVRVSGEGPLEHDFPTRQRVHFARKVRQ